ncbi:type 1 glutamine amidotransferase [Rhizobium sp. LEGMi135b]
MKRALVLQHADHDDLGRFVEFFAEDWIFPDFIRVWDGQAIPSLSGYDLMFSAGRPQDVWQFEENPWISSELEAIREWIEVRAKPFLGICLGYQLMAVAMGGKVDFAASEKMGACKINLTDEGRAHPFMQGLPNEQVVMQFHFAEVKEAPSNARVLSSFATCGIQSLAIGDHAFRSQFHCEHTPQTYVRWTSRPRMRDYLNKYQGPNGLAEAMEESFSAHARHTCANPHLL